MSNTKVTIIDYGMGNLFSIERAIRYVGGDVEITDSPAKVVSAERLILPGVGAFGKGMHELRRRFLIGAIYKFVKTGRPLLGICLGIQLFLTESVEFESHKGLNLVKGKVVRFRDPSPNRAYFKIPHIGWNSIELSRAGKVTNSSNSSLWCKTILEGLNPKSYFYFAHSFICFPDEPEYILAESEYGEDRFCSVLCKKNIWGCQFHPEKSAKDGLKIYENFIYKL